ncbi:NACHT, LRR and PYD domains-containing protein 1a allele 5-like [Engraulis encrasicolus]|uniref:NACHT, LRR and PYD domains-containing protein 1a allele 5-like n=1 Tax=Engraulis encrasicolus TaxID=184585 RepID=UPI002FD1AE89
MYVCVRVAVHDNILTCAHPYNQNPLSSFRLHDCDLSQASCSAVASVLQKPHCPLRELDLSGTYLGDVGVQLLCSGLTSPNCKLEVLRLHDYLLSHESCSAIASVLQQPHCPLRELDLSGNNRGDVGVQLLCSGLKSPNCKLEVLRLSGCHLTESSCLILHSVVGSDHSCLRELDVNDNDLEDLSGMLGQRLKDPTCKLETLKTGSCSASNPVQFQPPAITYPAFNTSPPFPSGSSQVSDNSREISGVPTMDSDYEYMVPDDEEFNQSSCSRGAEEEHDDDHVEHVAVVLEGREGGTCSDRSVVPEVFTPESYPYNGRKSYRFTCSSEGLFQCRYTGLVFKMDTAGDVEYRTEPWSSTQLKDSYVPAGPLFDIKCLEGTLSQLHLPHCEVLSGKGSKHLSVIHSNDSDKSEMLLPNETTDSHVVLNISGCSKYGLTKKQPKTKYSPINGLVLLFLQDLTLNVLLLPKNVDIPEVCEKRKKMKEPAEEMYIDTPPNCELVPKKVYCLCSEPKEHKVTPSSATFVDYELYDNYVSAFQVQLTKLENVELKLNQKGCKSPVWCNHVIISACPAGSSPSASPPSSPYTPPGQDFFHRHKAELETRLGFLPPILTELERCEVLNGEEREEVESKNVKSQKNQTLLSMLKDKGGPAQEEFYKVLLKKDKFLVKALENHPTDRTSA